MLKKRTTNRGFDQTRWSLVLRAGGASTPESRKALSELCAMYRAPLYVYACRFVKNAQHAEDLLQDFLTRLIERDVLRAADPARGSFRAFLKTSMKHHVLNAIESERAQKRGGGASHVDINIVEMDTQGASPEQLYDRQCAWAIVERAFARLREDQEMKGHGAVFEALRERLVGDDDGVTLRAEAERLGMQVVTVRVKLSRLRKSLGDILREEVAQTVARPEDVEGELGELLAALRAGR